jgi:hypothetical protein
MRAVDADDRAHAERRTGPNAASNGSNSGVGGRSSWLRPWEADDHRRPLERADQDDAPVLWRRCDRVRRRSPTSPRRRRWALSTRNASRPSASSGRGRRRVGAVATKKTLRLDERAKPVVDLGVELPHGWSRYVALRAAPSEPAPATALIGRRVSSLVPRTRRRGSVARTHRGGTPPSSVGRVERQGHLGPQSVPAFAPIARRPGCESGGTARDQVEDSGDRRRSRRARGDLIRDVRQVGAAFGSRVPMAYRSRD